MKERPTLQTARLNLRPFDLSDARDVQRLAGEKAIADTTLNIPHPYEDGMAEEWISSHQPKFEAGELANFAIVLREDRALIGSLGLVICQRFDRAVLGYWIGRPYWNNGYCTEAGQAILQYGFETLNLNRICASHLTRNPASGRVMKKLGMIHEGHARQHAKKWDIYEDLEFYGMIRADMIRP
ncbi:GNAT family N-acetyltransferase [Candidatus Poribacteria bacterium]|nr:GNAT family N-acetyltransferase [Candidatus Poribacteria bacterium]